MGQTPLTARRWTRSEFERLVALGVFQGEPLELLGGQLIVAEPQSSHHASTIFKVADVIRAALPPGFVVRSQGPIALDDESEPEPDVAVVSGTHDLVDRVLEVYRDPAPDPAGVYGWQYRSVDRLSAPAAVALLALPAVRLDVGALLP